VNVNTARRIAQRLSALPEPGMRTVVLREELTARDPADAVALMRELVTEGTAVVPLARALDGLAYDQRAELYAAAKSADLPEVAALLFEVPRPDPLPIEDRRRLTLGERKSLARGPRGEVLGRLLTDADASVIEILLGNPRLIERDVVGLAARRPARADVLRAVFESKWIARYAVKLSLVLNPNTPPDVALRLLAALSLTDLRRAAHDSHVGEAIRQQARRLVETTSSR
jgi:hypothetical protein